MTKETKEFCSVCGIEVIPIKPDELLCDITRTEFKDGTVCCYECAEDKRKDILDEKVEQESQENPKFKTNIFFKIFQNPDVERKVLCGLNDFLKNLECNLKKQIKEKEEKVKEEEKEIENSKNKK